jgi:hypothetical protein
MWLKGVIDNSLLLLIYGSTEECHGTIDGQKYGIKDVGG